MTLVIPAGALSSGVDIKITSTTQMVPAGYQAYSPMFKFEPEGTTFAKPVSLSIPFTGDPKLARVFWSRQGTTGYERLGGLASAGMVLVEATHFSTGFVANGVDYTDPPDLSCTRMRLLEARTGQPVSSAVSAFFTVDDCQGRPVTGLTCQSYPATCDFVVKEDATKLSSEAQATVLQKKGLNVFASLVLDVSSSTQAVLTEMIDGAKAFVTELRVNKGLDVPISIQLLAGEATLNEWQPPTLDTQLLLQRLSAVATYTPADPSSTNLYGGVISSLQRLTAAEADYRQRNLGGVFTAGYVVLFTDGADTAGLKTKAEALAAVAASTDQLLVVALRSVDFDAAANQSLVDLASTGVVVSQGPASLYGDFANLAARIAGQTNRTYLLGYCSPKRAGMHTVAIEIGQSTTQNAVSYGFNASTFQPGCSKTSFDGICDNKQCGGLSCGGCDDRLAACDPTSLQCVSYCVPQAKCGGTVITNPRGYQQTCNDAPASRLCGTQCVNTTTDPANCNACGTVCPVRTNGAGACVAGACGVSCNPGWGNCDADATNGCELRVDGNDVNNCGACGLRCAGGACAAGLCTGITIATGQNSPSALIVDGSNVSWCNANDGSVRKVPLAGGTVVDLAAPSADRCVGLARDGSNVYWTYLGGAGNNGRVMKLPNAGGPAVALASAQAAPAALAVDGTSVYWANLNDQTVRKLPLAGGTVVTLASSQFNITSVEVDASSVYWTLVGPSPGAGAVMKVPLAGGTPVVLASGLARPGGIALDGNSVYWSDSTAGTVMKVPLGGGPPVTLASGQLQPRDLAVNSTSVYWTNYSSPGGAIGRLMKVPLTGGTPVILATDQGNFGGIALDATTVYWTVLGGSTGADGGIVFPVTEGKIMKTGN